MAALRRHEWTEGKGTGKRGSHRTWHRLVAEGRSQTMTVVIGAREIPAGTLRGMARQAGMTLDELMRMIGE